MKKILVIGAGLSGSIVADTLKEKKVKIFLIDSGNFKKKSLFEYGKINLENSPKLSNLFFKKTNKIFLNFYKILSKDFFLTCNMTSGGSSNFWGGALEVPDLKFQKSINKNFRISIANSFGYLIKLLCPKQKTDKKICNKILYKKNFFFIKKFYMALMKNNFYDPWYHKFKYKSFEAKQILIKLYNLKNFCYIPNTNVQKIILKNKKISVVTNCKKLDNYNFDNVFVSCGSIATPILLKKSFPKQFPDKFRLFHTPMLKMAYFNFFINSNIKKNIINPLTNLPKIFIDFRIKKKRYLGSLVSASQFSNSIFGFSKYNLIFTLLKKFLVLGNLFLNQKKSLVYLTVKKNTKFNKIIAKKTFFKLDNFTKRKVNNFFLSNKLFSIPFYNFSNTSTGSDSHYTSSLFSIKKYQYSFFNNRVYVMDNSILPPGTYYPTFTILSLIRELVMKIKV